MRAGGGATNGFLLPQNVPIELSRDKLLDITDAYNIVDTGSACTVDIIETLGEDGENN